LAYTTYHHRKENQSFPNDWSGIQRDKPKPFLSPDSLNAFQSAQTQRAHAANKGVKV